MGLAQILVCFSWSKPAGDAQRAQDLPWSSPNRAQQYNCFGRSLTRHNVDFSGKPAITRVGFSPETVVCPLFWRMHQPACPKNTAIASFQARTPSAGSSNCRNHLLSIRLSELPNESRRFGQSPDSPSKSFSACLAYAKASSQETR